MHSYVLFADAQNVADVDFVGSLPYAALLLTSSTAVQEPLAACELHEGILQEAACQDLDEVQDS